MNQKEIWKDIPDYEGYYQVSNLGGIKSLDRVVPKKNGVIYRVKERILKPSKNGRGYLRVDLNEKTKTVHVLVAIAFLGHKPDGTMKIVVDHIDNDRLNNIVDNLQLITARENCSKDRKGSSKHTGVSKSANGKKWVSKIRINRELKHLGYFKTELEAHNAYQDKLNSLLRT